MRVNNHSCASTGLEPVPPVPAPIAWPPTWLTPAVIETRAPTEPRAAIPAVHEKCKLAEPSPDATGFEEANERNWASIDAASYRYLTAPRRQPTPCPWCGGRTRHNPLCCSFSFIPELTFGKHKGKRVSGVPADYLEWLLRSGYLREGLRREILNWQKGSAA